MNKTINIFVQDSCTYCDQLVIPTGVKTEKIYTNRDDYKGFAPANVPVMQIEGLNFEGPVVINTLLNIIANDHYKG